MSRRGRGRGRPVPSRFLGVDLAWGGGNPSGVVALAGRVFPLSLSDAGVMPDHAAALAWIAAQARGRRMSAGGPPPEQDRRNDVQEDPCVEERSVSSSVQTISSRNLLGERGLLRIEHDGEFYTLRLTRNNRLILTK